MLSLLEFYFYNVTYYSDHGNVSDLLLLRTWNQRAQLLSLQRHYPPKARLCTNTLQFLQPASDQERHGCLREATVVQVLCPSGWTLPGPGPLSEILPAETSFTGARPASQTEGSSFVISFPFAWVGQYSNKLHTLPVHLLILGLA